MSEACDKCGADISWQGEHHTNCDEVARLRDLLRRIAKANVIFPSMCANNMEAWNLTEELKQFASKRGQS